MLTTARFLFDIFRAVINGVKSASEGNRCRNCRDCLWKPEDLFLCNRFGFYIDDVSVPTYKTVFNGTPLVCYEFAKITDNLVPNNWLTRLAKDLRFRYFTKRIK